MKKEDATRTFSVLKDDRVKVKDTVTKAMMEAIKGDNAAMQPTLSFKAYAVQSDNLPTGLTKEQIWNLAKTDGSTTPTITPSEPEVEG